MCFKKSNSYFCKIENFAYGEINERSFSNPHPWWGKVGTMWHFPLNQLWYDSGEIIKIIWYAHYHFMTTWKCIDMVNSHLWWNMYWANNLLYRASSHWCMVIDINHWLPPINQLNNTMISSLVLGDVAVIFKVWFWNELQRLLSLSFSVKLHWKLKRMIQDNMISARLQ